MELAQVKKNFEKRGFVFSVFPDEEAAAAYLCQEIQGKRVAFGGSKTLEEIGLYEKLSENNQVFWHWKTPGHYEQQADVYVTSANGLSAKGAVINVDGFGNRVAGAIYGSETVFVVCGINKLAADLDSAVERVRNVAAPLNARRLGKQTPCAVKGDRCYDCDGPECICRVFSVMRKPVTAVKRYEIVLVEKNLGF